MSDISERRYKIILVVLLLLAAGGLVARAMLLGQQRDAALRRAEVAEIEQARIEGLLIAQEVSRADLLLSLSKSLKERIELVEEIAPGTKVRETIRWRTRTVTLPCNDMAPPVDSNPRLGSPPPTGETPPLEAPPAGPPTIDLYVVGHEARLESRAGNWLAIGEVDLVREEDDRIMATLPWEADASDLLVSDITLSRRGHRWLVGLGPGLIDGELGVAGLVVGPAWEPRLFRRSLGRWRPWATGVVAGLEQYVPSLERQVQTTQACMAAGIGLEW